MRAVRVDFSPVDGVWSFETNELPDWMGVADTFPEALEQAREGLTFFLEEPVRVIPVLVGSTVWPAPPTAGDTFNVGGGVVRRETAPAA